MKWFKKWLFKNIQDAQHEYSNSCHPIAEVRNDHEDHDTEYTLRIQITPARGGSVLCINRYDSKKDRNNRTVYIIKEDNNDVNQQIAEIITMEMYKQ